MANPTRRVGVVLFQLGGPDTPQAIEPFLFNLFCDPDIIDFPFARIGRKPLAKLISTTRAKKVQHHYLAIGGASTIVAGFMRGTLSILGGLAIWEFFSRVVVGRWFVSSDFFVHESSEL